LLASKEDIPFDPAAMIDFGTVVSVDLAEARCVVRTGDPDEDDAETPPIRWASIAAGKTRVWRPPSVGEQGFVIKVDGEVSNAVFLGAIVCDAFPPAGNSETNRIEFEDGSRIDYDPTGHAFEINLSAGATAKIVAPGGLTIDADVTINGNVQLNGDMNTTGTIDATTDVIGAGKSLKGHVHKNVSAGAALSGPPN
jgi:phage baseplate assembly protein V